MIETEGRDTTISVGEAAKVLGVTRGRVHQLLRDGRLPRARQVYGLWRIEPGDVEAYKNERHTNERT